MNVKVLEHLNSKPSMMLSGINTYRQHTPRRRRLSSKNFFIRRNNLQVDLI
jgi:hypothetical protein